MALSETQASELRQRLLHLRESIAELLDASADSAKPVDLDKPIGRLSRMDAIQQQKMAQETRRRTELRLRHVMAALAAVRADEYGECKRCEDDIAWERLNAMPEAPLCLRCANEIENR